MYLWHVHVIYKVDQTPGTRRSKVSASFLFQWFLQCSLQHFGGCVEVEGDIGNHEVFRQTVHFVSHQYCLTSTGGSNQHHWATLVNQHVQEVLDSCGLRSMYQGSLQTTQFLSSQFIENFVISMWKISNCMMISDFVLEK